jgi:hypothetical protein
MCDKGQKWDLWTLKCVPDSSTGSSSGSSEDTEKKDVGSPVLESILGNLSGILSGAGNFISATKGNPANVTNVYGNPKSGPSVSWVAVGAVIVLVGLLLFVIKKP